MIVFGVSTHGEKPMGIIVPSGMENIPQLYPTLYHVTSTGETQ